MEFWGTEVKSGQTFDVNLGEGKVLHLSQACIGEMKKEAKDSVCLHITVGDKKLVLGTLHTERLPQQLFDLVFDKDFKISHNWKNGSVFFYGYKADQPTDEHGESEDFESEDEEEELPLPVANGKPDVKKEEKAVVAGKKDGNAKASAAGKQKVKIVEPEKDEKDSDDEDDSDDSDPMLEDSDDDDEDNEDSSDDEEDSDEEEETPKKQESGKKRAKDSATKTPQPEKKAKITATPQKTEGKKGGAVHVATPHPSKQAVAKTSGGGNKSNQKSPASAADGAHSCKSCNRNFKTEGALSSHNQAKHTSK